MIKTFLIKVVEPQNDPMYQNHSTYHEGDAGLDLFIIEDDVIPPGETKLVDLGIQCQAISFNWNILDWPLGKFYNYHSYWLVPRSSISKTPLMMKNSIGLIDKSYTGNIKVPLFNTSNEPYHIQRGQRFCQLVFGDLSAVSFRFVKEHRQTTRGEGGFGSTGA